MSQNLDEVKKNYEWFKKNVDLFIKEGKEGKFALIHKQELVNFFTTFNDAYNAGITSFKEEGKFSIQEVTKNVINLGFHSCEF